jgi:predicted transcriptional regulator of viral defense system
MNYIDFKNKFINLGCFNINQIYAFYPDFNRNNLTYWQKKGWLIYLRNGFYAFPEFKHDINSQYFVANKIYRPSYVSLQSALSYYEIIPESVVQITNITTLKTKSFENDFGQFYYKSIKSDFYFGYLPIPISRNKEILIAEPEKAILDFLYLYPFYKTEVDFLDLRFNENILKNEIDKDLLLDYCKCFGKKSLDQRIKKLFNAYKL